MRAIQNVETKMDEKHAELRKRDVTKEKLETGRSSTEPTRTFHQLEATRRGEQRTLESQVSARMSRE